MTSETVPLPHPHPTPRLEAGPRQGLRMTFHLGLALAVNALVVLGFAKTFFLRPWFDTYEVHPAVLWHGVAMTAWFLWYLLQSLWVAGGRTGRHRTLGWIGVALAAVAVVSATLVDLAMAVRARRAGRDLVAEADRFADVLWSNLAPLIVFAGLFAAAILARRRPAIHARLVPLAAIALVDPALARIGILPDVEIAGRLLDTWVFPLGMMVLLPLCVLLRDLVTERRPHAATLTGLVALWVGIPLLRTVVPRTGVGLALVHWLA